MLHTCKNCNNHILGDQPRIVRGVDVYHKNREDCKNQTYSGLFIKQLRKRYNVTQDDLALRLGTTTRAVKEMESRVVSASVYNRVKDAITPRMLKPTKTAKDVRKQMGAKLKKLRTDAKLTRRKVAEHVGQGLNEDKLESYERGLSTPPDKLLKQIKKSIKELSKPQYIVCNKPSLFNFTPKTELDMLREEINSLKLELQDLKKLFAKRN